MEVIKENFSNYILGKSIFFFIIMLNLTSHLEAFNWKNIKGFSDEKIESNNIIREFSLYVPPNLNKNNSYPLVFCFHGGGGTGKTMIYTTGFMKKAYKEKFIIVFPNGTRPNPNLPAKFGTNSQTWNDKSSRGIRAAEKNVDDIKFVHDMVKYIESKYKIDKDRIYATGFSNGASFTFTLGIECSDIFAAIAPVSGCLWLKEPKLKEMVHLLYISGDSDPLNPIDGGEIFIGGKSFGVKTSLKKIISNWQKAVGGGYHPEKIDAKKGITAIQLTAKNKGDIEYYIVKGLGHHWSGGRITLSESKQFGYISDTLNATNIIWDFFAKHPKIR